MLANISHELRTRLARVRVVLETAQENPSRAQRLLGEIARDLDDLERLVHDVMASARLDTGALAPSGVTLPVRLEPTDIRELRHTTADEFQHANASTHVDVGVDVDVPFALGDAHLLLSHASGSLSIARIAAVHVRQAEPA